MRRFFFYRQGTEFIIKLHHTETFRIHHLIAENSRALRPGRDTFQFRAECMAEENIIPQHQAAAVITDKFLTDDKGLCQAVR
ncbi:Uncharacterised protein [Klebsiella pneumoniae]|nr:Uncharacterised protein [Klebsiella pneumoniae]